MNNTTKMSYDELLKRALGKGSKTSSLKSKFDKKKNYASFWMDDLGKGSDRFGISSDFKGGSSDVVKSIKLNSYRRAVANFVKILTNKEIPVRFHGTDSYTDGKAVTISTDIKDDNFDVTVGLALHEASHILLTDFAILPILSSGNHTEVEKRATRFPMATEGRMVAKELLNWVEDRRIDNYVFSTSPGYKAYYHKLYDYYFNNDKLVAKALKSKKFRNNKVMESWMMHIVNMTNSNFDPTAMEGLKEVTEIVNLANISRLKSTNDALDVVLAMMDVILEHLDFTPQSQQPQEEQQAGPGEAGEDGDEDQDNEDQDSEDEDQDNEDQDSENQQGGGSGSGEGESDEESDGEDGEGDNEGEDFTDQEIEEMSKHLAKQKQFTNDENRKKTASRNLTKKLEQVEKEGVTIEQVAGKYTCLNYDVTGKEFIAAAACQEEMVKARAAYSNAPWSSQEKKDAQAILNQLKEQQSMLDHNYFHNNCSTYVKAIEDGLLMGQLLGKKLQMRNESRERIDNRLRSGKIDNRRLASAGYGIESIFQQISVDKYKKANIHLSLDGSGSMGGTNWSNTVKLTAAIAKAITYTTNVSMQVSIRVTSYNSGPTMPVNYFIYDSRKNTLRELQLILGSFSPNGTTPEGLCFESMLKKGQLMRSDAEMDSYFVNLSDGGPGGVGTYQGETAKIHTRDQITKMRNELGMNILSYFMTQYGGQDFSESNTGRFFQGMYGKAATQVQPDNAMQIAKTLNNLFMGK